jgi:hypothetical protein
MFEDQDVIATTTQFDSNVDLIDAADVPVTVTTVAEAVAAKKGKRVNLATVTSNLKAITGKDLLNVSIGEVRDFKLEYARIIAEFKTISDAE